MISFIGLLNAIGKGTRFKELIYRMYDPDIVILFFTSGKLVYTSAVNEQMVYNAIEKLMAELIQKELLIR